MKKSFIVTLFLIPIFSFSQKIKKTDLIGEWKFKEMILISESKRDSIIEQMKLSATHKGGDYVSLLIPFDIKLTESEIYYYRDNKFELSTDYWTISSENDIIIHYLVPNDMVDYFLEKTFNVIEKLDNGKYYYQTAKRRRIIYFDKNKFITTDLAYNYIFERN